MPPCFPVREVTLTFDSMTFSHRIFHTVAAILPVAATVCFAMCSVMASCGREPEPVQSVPPLFQTHGFTLTPDYIVSGADTLCFPSSRAEKSGFSVTTSSQSFNYLAALTAADSVAVNTASLSNWELSTRIALGDAWLYPERSMKLLRDRVRGGRVTTLEQIRQYWPMISDCLAWIPAALEIYRATGDKKWLREAADVSLSTLRREIAVNYIPETGLFRSVPVYLLTPASHFAPWMNHADILQTYTLFNNVMAVKAMESLAQMNAALNRPPAEDIDSLCRLVSRRVATLLWVPDKGYFSEFLYGGVFPVQSRIADNMAQALTACLGAVYPPLASSAVSRTPRLPSGMPLTSPLMNPTDEPGSNPVSHALQSFWAIASLRAGNEASFNHALGAMALASSADDFRCDGAMSRLMLKGLLGLESTDTAVVFHPALPSWFSGVTEFRKLTVRDCSLDIRIKGHGNMVSEILLDGEPSSFCGVPYTLKGNHTLEVVLESSPRWAKSSVNITDSVGYATQSPQVFWCNLSAEILNFRQDFTYDIYVDGVLYDRTSSRKFNLPDTHNFTTVNLVSTGSGKSTGLAGRTFSYFPPRTRFVVPADTIEPGIKGRIRTVRNRRGRVIRRFREPHYVRMPSWRSALRFSFNASEEGEYIMRIVYITPAGAVPSSGFPMRRISVNGGVEGYAVMPFARAGYAVESSPVRVPLVKGRNRVELAVDADASMLPSAGEFSIKEIVFVRLPR